MFIQHQDAIDQSGQTVSVTNLFCSFKCVSLGVPLGGLKIQDQFFASWVDFESSLLHENSESVDHLAQ